VHYLRDGVFILGWFSLLGAVWFWWASEAPPRRARPWRGVGLALSVLGALVGGFYTWRFWTTRSMLDGRVEVFGLVLAATIVVAVVTWVVLARTGREASIPLSVAVVVALHFVPLGYLLGDWGLVVLALGQIVLTVLASRFAKRRELAPSYPIGVVMGVSLLGSAVVAAVLWLPRALAA